MHHLKDFIIQFAIFYFLIGFILFPAALGSNIAQVMAGYETMLPIWKRAQ